MGDYNKFIGELWPGAYGWLPLDNNPGEPNGPATINPPSSGPDVWACYVFANNAHLADPKLAESRDYDALLTSTGAPITGQMNSNVDQRTSLESQYKSSPKPDKWEETSHNRKQFRNQD